MTFFTPELYVRYQSENEEILRDAEQQWDAAVQRYDEQLRALLVQAPEGEGLFENSHLHDAAILALGQEADRFRLVLQLDLPYRTLILTYEILESPNVNRMALPPKYRSSHVSWLYDKVELVGSDPVVCDHFILLSNGWEVRLRFRDLQIAAFRSLLLTDAEQRRADESERLGAPLACATTPAASGE
jgi:hypothetical protein